MKYVIYGAGYRGKRLLDYIGEEHVCAFIDMDVAKQGTEYFGKPVISLEEYLAEYELYFIIITPTYSNNIEEMLEENGIYQYSNLVNMPSEFAGYGNVKFEVFYKSLKEEYDEKLCIYGLNALGFFIYDFLYLEKDIYISPEEGDKTEKIEWVRKYYPEIKIKESRDIQDDEIVLMSRAGQNEMKFSGKVLNLFEYASSNIFYRNESLSELKDRYKETKKCFIVATGPSLRVDDLHTLTANHIFCFGVNSIIKIKEEWAADAYVAADSNFIGNHMESLKDYPCSFKFIGDSCKEYWAEEHGDSYKIHVTSAGSGIDFSEEIEQKIYCGYGGKGTVTYVCIQLAVYMGFTEIYLLGVDCNYVTGSKNNHFYEEENEDNKIYREDLMILAYEYAKEYADAHGIKIYNATRGGKLEVFERVDFDSLLEGKECRG